jgi:hypothetical protein
MTYDPYATGWKNGYAEGYACKLVDVTNPFMPSGTAEEITRVADWLQTKYSRDYGADRPGAIRMARGMIKAARGEIPAIPKRDEVVADDSLCSDCPRVNYPTDETRCRPCPRRKIPCTGGDI